jgi:hypothetical protein
MPKFPEPPSADELSGVPPVEKTLVPGTLLWRIYRRGGRHPTLWQTFRHFGPLSARFDHHLPDAAGEPRIQARGTLYAASEIVTCLAEVYQESRAILRRADDQPWLVGFELAEQLALLDLTGSWPTRAGASMALSSGPRPRARRWSQAIYDAYPEMQGLWTPSSMYANKPVVSLYERAQPALPSHPRVHRPLNDPALLVGLDRMAGEIGYDLV